MKKTNRKISFGSLLLVLSIAVMLGVMLSGDRTVHYASAHSDNFGQTSFSEEFFDWYTWSWE